MAETLRPRSMGAFEERLAANPRLTDDDRVALRVWRLGRDARDLAARGDPDASAVDAAFRAAEAAAIEAEILMRRVDVEDLRARYPVLARDAEVTTGVGWQPILEALLDRLAGMSVTVTLVREKFGGMDVKVYPVGRWVETEFDSMRGVKKPAEEAALRTCEACGAPGTLRRNGRARTRCDRHADV
ncbi:hypothetical protein [Methylobacterium sp. 37f]|uniref:hypothetical protein n=1 Tax=Methylobacterium sp. 37f TaxID=2817058 RepID=UPI001FFD0D52|nr:hypothetical protein [Methylobacterium sp. 37f]MCK2056132.1 hypothetical protein [Methylobacterium sp. 37f]